jgi:hypothetical protein
VWDEEDTASAQSQVSGHRAVGQEAVSDYGKDPGEEEHELLSTISVISTKWSSTRWPPLKQAVCACSMTASKLAQSTTI